MIDITAAGRRFHFTPRNPISCIPADAQARLETGLPSKISGLQLDPSRCFFRGEYVAGAHPHTLLFFISEGYASNAAPVLVLGFRPDGQPFKVLELDEFDVASFASEAPNAPMIVGKPTLSQVIRCMDSPPEAPYATTYDPFAVYTVRAEQAATYSLKESRTYNLTHYVWAGPHSSEDYLILYNLPGHAKPFGAPAQRAQALLPHCRP